MLGSRTIGDRFVGAGRSVEKPKIPVDAQGAGSGAGQSTIRSTTPIVCQGAGSGAGTADLKKTIVVSANGVGDCTTSIAFAGNFILIGSGEGPGIGSAFVGADRPLTASGVSRGTSEPQIDARRPLSADALGRGGGQSRVGARLPVLATGGSAAGQGSMNLGVGRPLESAGAGAGEGFARFPTDLNILTESGRIVFIPPKFPRLQVEPKNRIIKIRTDDTGLVMATRTKQPGETVDYILDMREWFDEVDTQDYIDIAESSVAVDISGDPDDLELGPGAKPEIEGIGVEPQQARIWVAGGRDGIEYKVTTTLTTNQGRVEEHDLTIIIEEL